MDKEILEDLVNQGYTQRQIGEYFDLSQTTIAYWLKKNNLMTIKSRGIYKEVTSLPCHQCSSLIKNTQSKYCSIECFQESIYDAWISRWLANDLTLITHGLSGSPSGYIHRYLKRTRGWKCEECGWAKVNPFLNKIPLQIDHIDGDRGNSRPENLKILCGSCHSLTATWGSLNRGNGSGIKRSNGQRTFRPDSSSG